MGGALFRATGNAFGLPLDDGRGVPGAIEVDLGSELTGVPGREDGEPGRGAFGCAALSRSNVFIGNFVLSKRISGLM